jgi:ribonuclease R
MAAHKKDQFDMGHDLESRIIKVLTSRAPKPVEPTELARRLGLTKKDAPALKRAIRNLIKQARIEYGKNHKLRAAGPLGTITGTFRRLGSGGGIVRPHLIDGHVGPDILVKPEHTLDASHGDEVLVRLTRRPARAGQPLGQIVRIIERATQQFVGRYFERDGQGLVRVDGTVFSRSVYVGDPGAKGAKAGDQVVIEMLRFPSPDERGEGVIIEVLGPRGEPGVDTLSIIRTFGIPDEFPKEVLAEAREIAKHFDENDLTDREDFTRECVITIDPVDAKDFDDAISLRRERKNGHWCLTVHIADVSYFVRTGGAIDREAQKRGNSVYLPQRVIPMLPEVISNSLASLQQGRNRYVLSVKMEFTPSGQRIHTEFVRGVIRNRRRFHYEEVSRLLAEHDEKQASPARMDSGVEPDIVSMLCEMREFALILRERRRKRGALELALPETELEYDDKGRVVGAHLAVNDISHQIIEEFMLATNEAVAEHLASIDAVFLRRVHPAPDPEKLQAFAEFAHTLGYRVDLYRDRFALQRVLEASRDKPEQHAIHFSLLRSLKQAVYSPHAEGHYALASGEYCHFTSPIRRYPDLTVHRLLHRWLKTGKAGGDRDELVALGEHCSRTEKRAESAERELVKWKLLTYMESRIGERFHAIITGVADYGFYAQAIEIPVEGLVPVSSLTDDYYAFDADSHTLQGLRRKRRYRLGDRVQVEAVRVDVGRRLLDWRVVQ